VDSLPGRGLWSDVDITGLLTVDEVLIAAPTLSASGHFIDNMQKGEMIPYAGFVDPA
jgi:hypothetical protein